MSAEESTVQTLNRPALEALKTFLAVPTRSSAQGLYGVPVLYKVLDIEYDERMGKYPVGILNVARWMFNRAKTVLEAILSTNTTPLDLEAQVPAVLVDGEIHEWEKVVFI